MVAPSSLSQLNRWAQVLRGDFRIQDPIVNRMVVGERCRVGSSTDGMAFTHHAPSAFQHCESFTTELCDTEVFYYDEMAGRKSLPKHGGGRDEDMILECLLKHVLLQEFYCNYVAHIRYFPPEN